MPPDVVLTEAEREIALTTPSEALIRQINGMAGTLMIVGAGGKMGPTLAVLAARAVAVSGSKLKIIAVSRFSDPAQKEWLQARNVSTIAADLLNDAALVGELPRFFRTARKGENIKEKLKELAESIKRESC